jgi:trehalose 6-phosphate phosphatase
MIAFDFDGTLAPITADRADAVIRAHTRQLLGQLVSRYPCCVISGRQRADLLTRLQGIAMSDVVGNHGAEPSRHAGRYAQQVADWLPMISSALAEERGIEIEDKYFSLAIHYRGATDHQRARDRIGDALAPLGRTIGVVEGKAVVNVVVPDAPDKAAALLAICRRRRCRAALFIGDDATDEHVFALSAGWLTTIRVGHQPSSAAQYYLRDQEEVDALLEILIALRNHNAHA